ncbi:MAG: hypothetical protein QM779_12620 [Propionicimonas sp.]|uniref:hypothetical protein n=1 Tax=Propionicimonas sp. TaxID=1955623 RepID=UPI003D0D2A29
MSQPDEDRRRGTQAARVAGVGLGLLGATFGGVAGWFTLAPAAAAATTTVVTTHTGTVATTTAEAARLRSGSGRVHTRTGGA